MTAVAEAFCEKPFVGQWHSPYGLIELRQKDSWVEGTYSCCRGTITGTVTANRLKFQWKDDLYGQGWGEFTMGCEDESLNGSWGLKGKKKVSGPWDAKRIAKQAQK